MVFSHSGDVDPVDEGWSRVDAIGTAGPVEENGFLAWAVDDPSTAGGSRYNYRKTPSASDIDAGHGLGWTLSARLRIVGSPDTPDFSVSVEFGDGLTRYALYFGSQADGDPIVILWDGGAIGSGLRHVVEGGGSRYHRYDLILDPTSGASRLLVEGVEVLQGYQGFPAAGVPPRVVWGSNHSAGAGRAHYNLVSWALPEDRDLDGIPDTADHCIFVQNQGNLDSNGDGLGDACQCLDLDGDGLLGDSDIQRYRAFLLDPDPDALSPEELVRCAGYGDFTRCDLLSLVLLRRSAAGLPPPPEPACAAATGFGNACGDGLCSEGCWAEPIGCQRDCGRCRVGAPCVINADCASGICLDRHCAAREPFDPLSPGFPEECADGVCNGSDSCTTVGFHGCPDDCGKCKEAGTIRECRDDTECGGSRVCQPEGICGPCTQDSDCGKGVCMADGSCADHCIEDRDCRSETGECLVEGRCNVSGFGCAVDSDCTDQNDDFCNTDFHRIPGTTGFFGLCSDFATVCPNDGSEEIIGETIVGGCRDVGDPSGICYRRKICHRPVSTGVFCGSLFANKCPNLAPCSLDADCLSGNCFQPALKYLRVGLLLEAGLDLVIPGEVNIPFPGVCTPALPPGGPCEGDGQCVTNNCSVFGFCSTDQFEPCLIDSNCNAANPRCVNGVCVPDRCGDGFCEDLESACQQRPMQFQSPVNFCQEDCGKCPYPGFCTSDVECASGVCDATVLGSGECAKICGDGFCDDAERCTKNLILFSSSCPTDCGRCNNGYRCSTGSQCASGHCEQGFCAPPPPTCNDLGSCPNGSVCSANGDCASGRCLGSPLGGTRYCIQTGCTAPGGFCLSSSSCCDFPGVNLSCKLGFCRP